MNATECVAAQIKSLNNTIKPGHHTPKLPGYAEAIKLVILPWNRKDNRWETEGEYPNYVMGSARNIDQSEKSCLISEKYTYPLRRPYQCRRHAPSNIKSATQYRLPSPDGRGLGGSESPVRRL
jgi:hypothetical protein